MKQFQLRFNHLVRNRSLLLLFITIILAAFMQGILAANKITITHDETISYLSATVNQGDFERIFQNNVYPANRWVSVGTWKEWFELDKPFSFRQIGIDLAESDIHPPLYFWLLHLWTWLFDVHPWTGPTLNILLQAIGAIGLFHLARRVLKDNFEALAVVFIWSVSPAVLTATLEARQYTLFGVFAIFFIWLIVIAVDRLRALDWRIWILLAIVTAGGALTHYQFILIVAGAVLIFVLKLLRHDLKRVAFVGTAVTVGYLLSFVLHPRFYQSIQELSRRQALEAQYLSSGLALAQRMYAVGKTFTSFWSASSIIQLILFCVALTSLIWLGLILWKNPDRIRQYAQTKDFSGYEVGLFFVWIGGISILLYLTFVSPVHAMTARHMSAVWPFFPFLAILLLRMVQIPNRNRIILLLGTAVFLSGMFTVWQGVNGDKEILHTNVTLANVNRVVADGVYQGIFPRIFLQLPDDTLIYATSQNELLKNPKAWLPMLDTNSVYISELSYDNTAANRDRILALIEQRFKVTPQSVETWLVGTSYFLAPLN